MSSLKTDVLIVGSGIGGLYTALNLDAQLNITIVTNSKIRDCNSYLAQGGVTTVIPDDEDSFIEDTLAAGHFKNNHETLKIVARESWKNIKTLIDMGAEFQKNENGELKFTKEAAHSKKRILFHGSETGKMIMETLIENIEKRENITILEDSELLDLKIFKNSVYGGFFRSKNKNFSVDSKIVVLATGGIGGLFKNSTNHENIKGISLALAQRHNIEAKDIECIQLHPTALDDSSKKRLFLLSEALRGEGAVIRDAKGERFVDELLPRDKVTESIIKRKNNNNNYQIYLDATELDSDYIKNRFEGIYNECFERGYDITTDLIPISPAQHYFMGGIKTNLKGRSSCQYLYVVGEAACTGLHGKNRLASNSLLEALVFGRKAASDINIHIKDITLTENLASEDEWCPEKAAREIIIRHRGDLKNELRHY
ncbi:L-aspartate oxidase [Ilyobacter polytropus]|uniref:L-aspartate oxidase n=1 Tax=Ilyobacter polytropus (strain ATCC 51220 / DSM 2926 / LMG 16218 / CuHBu1) TaxID=572544 RepID=E3HD84_ILYPC|nr:fumarate reductase/succinate dehydrogenase flavoprotein domain protein [Ilyobacter polytropus DSM 2926]